MTKKLIHDLTFWAQEFDRRLIQYAARKLKPARSSRIVRALEQAGQPFELDLLGIDPEIFGTDPFIQLLDDERVLKLSAAENGLPSEVIAWNPLRGFRISEQLGLPPVFGPV